MLPHLRWMTLGMLFLIMLIPWRVAAQQASIAVTVHPYAEMVFTLKSPLRQQTVMSAKQEQLYTLLGTNRLFATAHLRAYVQEQQVTLHTEAANATQAQAQLTAATRAMTGLFGKGAFQIPPAAKVFHPVDDATRRAVSAALVDRLGRAGISPVFVSVPPKDTRIQFLLGPKPVDEKAMLALFVPGRLEFLLVPPEINIFQDRTESMIAITRRGIAITDAALIHSSYLVVDGSALTHDSEVTKDIDQQPVVSFQMNTPLARAHFAHVTGANVGRQLAIILDGKVISAPVIKEAVPGEGIIAGSMTEAEARRLAILLNTGALPAPISIFVGKKK